MSYIYRLNETAVADEDGKKYTIYGINAVNVPPARVLKYCRGVLLS